MTGAAAAVHTTGVNWESITIICGAAATIMATVGAWIRRQVKTSVDHLAEVLDARLETKEAVAELRTRVTVLERGTHRAR
jgi:hypothetical protein